MNLINFPQRSNQHIILKYMGNKSEHLPRSYQSLSLLSVLQMLLSLASIACKQSWRMTGECVGKDQFIPSSNQCAIWIHLNALNHAPNVDGSRVWASVMQECYIALVWTHFIKYLWGKKKKCIKIGVNRITLKFLMCWELLTCIVLNTECSFVQVSLFFGLLRVLEESDMSWNFFFSHSLFRLFT